jgi:hypothetical protein
MKNTDPARASATADTAALTWAVLILIVGSIAFSISQLIDSDRQLADLSRSLERIHPQLQSAEYQEFKLHALATDVLRLAPADPVAEQLVVRYKIRSLRAPEATAATQAGNDAAPQVTQPRS